MIAKKPQTLAIQFLFIMELTNGLNHSENSYIDKGNYNEIIENT